ncbi:FAD/NAD(P)-binding protein [Tepidiforma thermophila]|uniref:Ferredoxin--NADP+ reductase n=1 Tax=Tepidiforma thermophila (strain KCTC 52669 / CGMCC 1.13589 / G233) TaxID=2761530 RepID=A0A2A9HBA0_TEPT2|nr:FAD/NAD(P)-binding protein [Tepidiforma thermophila]PFG73028.1 ferredoxin--NADP+ reductase [Tepidiforma thermophila]
MSSPSPLRVAIIGSGPAAMYTLEHLLAEPELDVTVDVFERLFTPYGLVRAGVAPDHQKIKGVTRAFEPLLHDPRVRLFASVEYGRDLALDDLRRLYHAACFATGAQSDRRMGIPGEDLPGSLPATAFVAWYNGHPDYCTLAVDLAQEAAVIVGMGNVAIDVARILCLTPGELRRTDMPAYAIEALEASRIREVHVLGRRGPAQAAFTTPELKELTTLEGAALRIRPDEAALDPLSAAEVERSADRTLARKVQLIQEIAASPGPPRPRTLHLRFCITPLELLPGPGGTVAAVRCTRTRLVATPSGGIAAEPTGEEEVIPAGLVFRSVGYRALPLPGLPFDDRLGVVPNRAGRVIDPATGAPLPGLYVAGWLKRGPTGVIGTNKPDAAETVRCLVEDAAAGRLPAPPEPGAETVPALLAARGVRWLTCADWQRIDRLEREAGAREGRPRVKFTSLDAILAALEQAEAPASAP